MLTVKDFIEKLEENPFFSGEFVGELRGTKEGICRIYDTEEKGVYVELEVSPEDYPPGLYKVSVSGGSVKKIERVRDVREVVKEVYRPEDESINYRDTEAIFREIEEKLNKVKEEIGTQVDRISQDKSLLERKEKRDALKPKDKTEPTLKKIREIEKVLGEILLLIEEKNEKIGNLIREDISKEFEDVKFSLIRIENLLKEIERKVLVFSGKLSRFERDVKATFLSNRKSGEEKIFLLLILAGQVIIILLFLLERFGR